MTNLFDLRVLAPSLVRERDELGLKIGSNAHDAERREEMMEKCRSWPCSWCLVARKRLWKPAPAAGSRGGDGLGREAEE